MIPARDLILASAFYALDWRDAARFAAEVREGDPLALKIVAALGHTPESFAEAARWIVDRAGEAMAAQRRRAAA